MLPRAGAGDDQKCHGSASLCLSDARYRYIYFDTSFVAQRALVREIILKTYHTYPATHIPI